MLDTIFNQRALPSLDPAPLRCLVNEEHLEPASQSVEALRIDVAVQRNKFPGRHARAKENGVALPRAHARHHLETSAHHIDQVAGIERLCHDVFGPVDVVAERVW